ncbi:MAG TPA: aromatic amino acid transport family protein [Chlamydiales bacterium]|nr:aromatic amino acid transport family protein [Chlamydiales bacterium]
MSAYQSSTTTSLAQEKKGSLIGSILLICGSSIGVGMLPLPILTGQAGTLPTLAIFVLCWLFMTTTALLLLESSLLFTGKKNFISLSKNSLNKVGQSAVFLSFMFLFYSLTTAYLAKGGELVNKLLQDHSTHTIPTPTGAIFLALLSGALIFMGPYIVDHINRIFMAGLLSAYLYITFAGTPYFHIENSTHIDWSFSLFIVPFLITSFGYHNMLPSINEYLGNDRKKLILTILLSGLILFLIYNIWVIMMQGIIPLNGETSILNSFAKGEIATEPLARLISLQTVRFCAEYMAFFAIITSLLGQGLSIIDFLADTLTVQKTPTIRLLLCLALFLPTLICSQIIPGVFFKALELVGGVAAMVLFGIIPALMSWVNRYKRNLAVQPLVPGGKATLILVIALASLVIGYELLK